MSESKRSLRERRAPKNFDSDNDEIEQHGYGRFPGPKEIKTPAQIRSQELKLFIKFINNTNKSAKEYALEQKRKNHEGSVELENERIWPNQLNQHALKDERKLLERARESLDTSKKSKEGLNLRLANENNTQVQFVKNNETFISRMKNISMQSANNMLSFQSGSTKKQPEKKKNQPEKPSQNGKKFEKLVSNTVANSQNIKIKIEQMQNGGFFPKQKEKARKMNEIQEKLGLKKTNFSESCKIFKRSAYHVAICYHIYLKKLTVNGPISGDIDPTIHARKLRERMKGRQ